MEIQTVAERPTLTIRTVTNQAGIGPACARILPQVHHHVASHGLKPACPPFVVYHSFSPDQVDMSGGFILQAPAAGAGEIEAGTLPGGRAVVTMHVGPYDTLGKTHLEVQAFCRQQGSKPGLCWEVYWTDPIPGSDPNQWKTEVVYLLN